ncbi:MAG TPA: outer membrane protein assembly factor BamD [Candidatus Saccharimonadales bacterium]|nr:outer membrane protein assembly factor BamD [Candidatus Saccharimonadales bacterium]
MFRRVLIALLLAASLLTAVACKNKKATNPLAHINSKQPDKVLFDRSMEAMKQRKYDVARMTLQTLINTYPDSEFVARAKLTVGESWYQEGTTAALAQAETEFRDFITFFPNMPEAAEAQLKIADIHYRQMEKPDRDYAHARRAEDEYRQLLMQYPDSKLADTARQRLLEVQEVLAEREFRIARFYYLRQSLLASVARAKTLTDTYPLYSKSDEALFMLGQCYEQQAERTRQVNAPDALKQKLIKGYLDNAAQAYDKIVTRYPAMPRYQDARSRLSAIDRPVPTPTPEAVALNKKELNSRTATTRYGRFLTNMSKRPDLSAAVRVGDPSLVDPKPTDAPNLVREINSVVKSEMDAKGGTGKVSVETVNGEGGKIPENQPVPRSPEAAMSPSDIPAQAPPQLNESALDSGDASSSSTPNATTSSSTSTSSTKDDSKNSSSSRKAKKKRHLKIPIPF